MSIVIFIVILAALILVHELGHFLAAKRAKIRVDEFGLGLPPRAYGYTPKNSETMYSLNWIPFGGFVKIFGEDPDDESLKGPDKNRSLTAKNKLVQIWVLSAGVIFNIIFAWLLISIAFSLGISTAIDHNDPSLVGEASLTIFSVFEDMPASEAGVLSNDVILFAEHGEESLQFENLTAENFRALVNNGSNDPLILFIERDSGNVTLNIEPTLGEEDTLVIGVYLDTVGIVKYAPPKALYEGARFTGYLLRDVTVGLGTFFGNALKGEASFSNVSGPVGIVKLVGEASALGFVHLLTFTAFISLNLAVINIAPFPALDGGRILFVIIEKIKGSPIKPKIANALNGIGFALLILLMVLITFGDVVKLIRG